MIFDIGSRNRHQDLPIYITTSIYHIFELSLKSNKESILESTFKGHKKFIYSKIIKIASSK